MAEFDTTKTESQYYGIRPTQGVVTPEAAYYDPNSIGGIAELVEGGLDIGDKYNTIRVGEEAEATAMELADQYYQQSTGQFEQGVDVGNQRLVNTYMAGVVNPYEFKTRIETLAQQQINMNPSKADVITSKMKDVFERTGVANRLALDEEMYKAEMERIAKEKQNRDKILMDKAGIDITNMPEEEKQVRFFEYQLKEEQIKIYEQDQKLNEGERKQIARDKVAEMVRKGTFREEKDVIITSLTRELEAINRDPKLNDQTKRDRFKRAMQNANKRFLAFYGDLSAVESDNPEVKNLFANVKAEFEFLSKEFENEFTQESITKALQNTASRAKAEIDLEYYESDFGKNEKLRDAVFKEVQALTLIKEQLKDADPELAKSLLEKADKILEQLPGILQNDISKKDRDAIFDNEVGEKYTNYIKSNIQQIKEEAKAAGIDPVVYNVLKQEQDWISSKKSEVRFNKLDTELEQLAMSPVSNILLDGPSDYKESLNKNLEFYKSGINYYMLNTYDEIPNKVGMTKDGMLVSKMTDNSMLAQTFANDLERINNFITVVAKMNNVEPSTVAEKILNEEFPSIAGKGSEIVQVNSQQEWKALKPGTRFMLPNGQIGTKQAGVDKIGK